MNPVFEHIQCTCKDHLSFDDAQAGMGTLRYIEHGVPNAIVRWHCHDEYELHMIVASSGKAFVGDYIGPFCPGHLVLTGPRLPHNWVSSDLPPEGLALRDRVLQFAHAPLRDMMRVVPELQAVSALLERAHFGIEFFGVSDLVAARMDRMRSSCGLSRFAEFLGLLSDLVACKDYRLLSHAYLQGCDDIDKVVHYLAEHHAEPLTLPQVARSFQMSEFHFSRVFKRSTGNSFKDFLIQLRVAQACRLLMHSNQQIADIGYAVGFHNLANFNRRFLEVKGATPSAFRRAFRDG